MFLIFDTETTGLPRDYNAPISNSDNWPRMVQLAWQLHDETGKLISAKNYIIKPVGFDIPIAVANVHGITTERALKDGVDLQFALEAFKLDLEKTTYNVGHNIEFDINIVGAEFYRLVIENELANKVLLDTMKSSVDFCALKGGRGGGFKYPKLTDLHIKLFNKDFGDAHDAAYDVDATARCFFELLKLNVIQTKETTNQSIVYEAPTLAEANFAKQTKDTTADAILNATTTVSEALDAVEFVHLHNHTEFSVLQSTTKVAELVKKAKELEMKAVALTDHGNMMATFHFVREAQKEGIKPIVGCEFNLCYNRKDKKTKDNGFQTVLIAKNEKGYHNLVKLVSYSYTEGAYYVPRIDRELLLTYKDDLIAFTGGIWGEVPNKILFEGTNQAEEAFVWWKTHFGDDFYVEINRHGVQEEEAVNKVLLDFAQKHNVKCIAANNTYYLNKIDAVSQDVLLCIGGSNKVAQPKKYIGSKGREFRFGFPNDEYYFKSKSEMKQLFADLPDAVFNTIEVANKIEEYKLERNVLLPKFDIPEEFKTPEDVANPDLKIGENAYLRHITYQGAKERYGEITDEIKERIDFELSVIKNTGYPGYFLIVEDFIREARKMGVSVGPGRGSAAGSVVAYCTKITNIDPIKYDLLFERFLNPDRISMPDIDIDFDDEGRQLVMDYVIKKYGKNQVAQIITYGKMAAKSAIRDTARVLDLPLSEANLLAKLLPKVIPNKWSINRFLKENEEEIKKVLRSEEAERIKSFINLAASNPEASKTIHQAKIVEGALRNTGIHACGVIITPDDITNFVPIATAKDSEMACTQFDNSVVEDAGLLKMDFLGLSTLTIIKNACTLIKERHGITLDPEKFDIEDEKTYQLFQKGATNGIFQYESDGMQKHLKDLKPTVFADLIAMNALYRPGPIEYIPSFVKRKHGEDEVVYDLPEMEEYLKETYGITVYQEQVMLLSQKLANFTKGEADMLRKAMGKKLIAVLDKMKPKFIEQAKENGHPEDKLEKIWKDWEAFAAYAFNKSHSTCYAWIGFQTAYLKAHYPAEYMAAVLSNNMNNIDKVTFFMDECKRMQVKVLGPDVNESGHKFTVNTNGEIRFGLGAIKGVGEKAVECIIEERKKNGHYSSIFDLTKRIDLRAANKKTLESLALAGAFDSFPNTHRAQYFAEHEKGIFLEIAIKHGSKYQENANSAQVSMFDMVEVEENIAEPQLPHCEEWSTLKKLNAEKDVVGIFISGHPLDDFKLEMKSFCVGNLEQLSNLESVAGKEFSLATICVGTEDRMTKNGNPFGILKLQDYYGAHDFYVFGEDYIKFKPYFIQGQYLYVKGKVQTKQWAKEKTDLEFKITNIELLSELRAKRAKALVMNIKNKDVTEKLIEEIYEILHNYPGNFGFKFNIKDEENGVIALASRSMKIDLSNELISKLDNVYEINYKIEG